MKKCSKKRIRILFFVILALFVYSSSTVSVWARPHEGRTKWENKPSTGSDFWTHVHDSIEAFNNWLWGDNSGYSEEEKEDLEEYKKVYDAIECTSNGEAKDLSNFYGIEVKSNGSTFDLTMEIKDSSYSSYSSLRNAKPSFVISRILIAEMTTDIIGYGAYLANPSLLNVYADYFTEEALDETFGVGGKVLTDRNTITFPNVRQDMVMYYVVLESTDSDSIMGDECGLSDAKSYFAFPLYSYGGGESEDVLVSVFEPIPESEMARYNVDCEGDYKSRYPVGSFERNYCDDSDAIINLSDPSKVKKYEFQVSTKNQLTQMLTYQDYIKDNPNSKLPTYQCNALNGLSVDTKRENYYTEKNYIVGHVQGDIKIGDYIYNYGGIDPETGISKTKSLQETDPINCHVDCTEIVTIEYGPPVASKAGMCFEYKVKVTSRVNCNSYVSTQPRTKHIQCTPSAYCWDPSPPPPVQTITFYNVDGPNEDFDSCILDCDGGKYSTTCSKKCYQEVYGTSAVLQKENTFDFSQVVEKLLNQTQIGSDCLNRKGYFYSTGSVIYWDPANCVATPYLNANGVYTGRFTWVKDHANGGGIPCAKSCSLRCRWTSCNNGKTRYLNAGEKEADEAKNRQLYEEAQKECNRYSKCSEAQSVFSISVDYNYSEKGTTKKTNIQFPYNTEADKIQYQNDSITCSFSKEKTTILSSDGCYKCSNDPTGPVSYQTEWGLPSTWINYKNGTIDYEAKPTGTNYNSWVKVNTFCLPFDAQDINQRWWNAYYFTKAKKENIDLSYEDDEYIGNIDNEGCKITGCDTTNTFTSTDKVDYNIHAKAESFGLFQWDINVDCFYALNSNFPSISSSESSCTTSSRCDKVKDEPYTIHSVDLANMFPSKEEVDDTRSPGFNWSQYATVSQEKNNKYNSLPNKYADWIQKDGYKITYNDANLDYKIELTRENIRDLRNDDKSSSGYSSFKGEVDDQEFYDAGVSHYKSPLFRGTNAMLSDSYYPDGSTLKCNNIGKKLTDGSSYSAGCFDYEKGE